MPSNGRSLLYGISISNVPDDRLDELCSMCSTGGRVLTGGYVSTGGRVRYSVAVVAALWPMVMAVGLCSTGGLVYAVICLTKHLNNGDI